MVGTSMYFFQEKILFRPTTLAQDYRYSFNHTFEELFLQSEDGAIINALHFKAEDSKGAVLYFHGNAGDLSRWGTITEYFVKLNYDVLVMDYRTYGKSTGVLNEQALYNDAQLCYDKLKESFTENQITIYGRSLGTAIATKMAATNSPKQLILETPYYSIIDVAKMRFPFMPVTYLMNYELPTHKFINNVQCPIYMFHGTEDYVVPFKSGEKLFKAAPKDRTTFVTIKNARHNNLIDFDLYHQQIKVILP
jgi:alpha-beta hydrolase superfamily lysophospholipase